MAITYSKKMLIERIKRHMADGFPNDEFTMTDNEILLYIDSALAALLVGNVYGLAKVTGAIATPEAYIVTTELDALIQDNVTGEWYATLPQTPISLPLGYSITNVYFGTEPVLPIKTQRVAFRDFMPKPIGSSYRVKGNNIYVKAKDNSALAPYTLYVDMVSTRTSDVNESMNVPDDIIQSVFDTVVERCIKRLAMPKDIVKDYLGAGNKSS